MVDISRRDLMASTAVVAMGHRAMGTTEANPTDDDPGPRISDPNSAFSRTATAALHLDSVPWSDVPGISEEEADEFIDRLWTANKKVDGESWD